MYEDRRDLERLQGLLDASIASSGEHLRSIVTPGERTLTAEQLVAVLPGMTTLALATVTAAGEPRLSAVDAHLLRGSFVFTTSGSAWKARHLRVRPAVSAAHLRGDDLGVFVHGRAQFLDVETSEDAWIEEHLLQHYGSSPSTWGPDIVYLRIDPSWMLAYAHDPRGLPAAESARSGAATLSGVWSLEG